MVSSSLVVSGASSTIISPQRIHKIKHSSQNSWGLSFVSFFMFIGFALILAPESPNQLGSICEKHNPVVACRVW